MFRRLTPSRSAYGSLSKVRAPFDVWHLVEKVGPVRHTEARRKVRLARRMEACRSTHPFRRWQKMPQWGPIAWIWERAAGKRHDGAFSWADILRLSFRKIT